VDRMLADMRNLTPAEVGRMNEALAWAEFTRPNDRMLIGMALDGLASGQAHVEWGDLRARLGLPITPNAVRMRYSRAISNIALRLNALI